MKQEHYYQDYQEIFDDSVKKSEKKPFFVSKTLNTVSPAILSTSSLILAYQFSLGLLFYILIPLVVISVYYVMLLLFKFNSLQYDNFKMNDKIDIVMKQNQKLYEEIDLLNNVTNYPQKIILDPLKFGESEIYIRYKQLNITFLSDFLREFENFYLLMYGVFNTERGVLEGFLNEKKFDKIKFIEYVKTVIKSKPENILVLDHVHTGESIRIRPSTSWKIDLSKFKTEGDVTIQMPMGFYILYFSVKYLSIAVSCGYAGYEIFNKIFPDKNEPQIIYENVSKLKYDFEILPEYIKDVITDSTNNFLEITVRDETIHEFTIKVSK